MVAETLQFGEIREEEPNKKYEEMRAAFVGAELENISLQPISLEGLANTMAQNAKKNNQDVDTLTERFVSLNRLAEAAKAATSQVGKRDAYVLEQEVKKFALYLDGVHYGRSLEVGKN